MPENDLLNWRKFPAVEESYEEIRDYILDAAENYGVNAKNILRLELGVEEVVINVIHYAYEKDGNIFVKVSDDKENNQFILDLVDFGKPFNPLKKVDPRSVDKSNLEERKIGGFGIAFIKKKFAALEYNYENYNGKNANHLTLAFKKG